MKVLEGMVGLAGGGLRRLAWVDVRFSLWLLLWPF